MDGSLPSPPPLREPRLPFRPWHPILRSLLFLVVFFLLQLAAALLLGFVVVAADLSLSTGASALAVFALTAPLLAAATVAFLRLLDHKPLAGLGVRWPVGGRAAARRQAAAGAAAALGLLAVWLGLVAVSPRAAVRCAGWNGGLAGGRGGLQIAALLAGFLVQGSVEEWLVRGYIYHALRERWRAVPAALASSLVFAALHGANPDLSAVALANTFLAGVIFAFLVERTASLWSAAIAHGVWNFAVSSLALQVSGVTFPHLVGVSVSGPRLLTGDGFGPEGSLLLTALALPIAWKLGRRAPIADLSRGVR